ncbi:dipeptidyl aminopeptidase/acylaminoacyl peptidase [Balneicella halophila]|uniref:Dipeptidyl aminopeptidase/acylaminoacyl peptidase n=1 Tax=Balneicella halophila TaxID=1537566 RepID=A0A7L4UQ08_BALHA|nr:S9 family peptidase [Balneicella halophila]PVX51865.1 dipeptidyl aminopeptidase/acylaminoacyl peptidase [Balneicella halophila]
MKNLILITFMATALLACTAEAKDKGDNKEGYVPEKVTLDSDIMTPEVLNALGRIGGVSVSPDKNTVLYSVTYPKIDENKMYKDWYTIALPDGKPVRITNTAKNEGGMQWRPDGKKIGFILDGQLWEMNPDGTGRTQRSDIEEGINGFNYSPDMKHIYYLKDVSFGESLKERHPDMDKANAHFTDHMMSRHWDHWVTKYSHIFITTYSESNNLEEGKDIMEGEQWESPVRPFGGTEQVVWLPNSKELAYVSRKKKGRDYAVSTNTDIYFYNIETGETKNVTEGNLGYDKNPVFSPDGTKMAWESMERDGYEADKERIFIMNLATGEKEDYTSDFEQMLAHGLSWSSNGDAIYFISDWHAKDDIYKLNLSDKKVTKVTEGVHNYKSVEVANDILVATKQSMSQPSEMYTVNPSTGEAKEISFVNADVLNQLKMGEVKERWVKTTDGKDMLVWMIYPPNFDPNKKYPTLLYCQGGPQGTVSQFWSYRWNFQMMSAKGYIIVAPNRRGLQGFGREWLEQISKDYGGQNQKDYLSAIDDAAKESYVDKENLGAIGASYGGYSVYWLAGNHNKRFSAFISHAGMFNLEAMYLGTEEMFFVNWDLGGAYWDKSNKEAQRTFSKFSPHKYVNNWDTPILVIHGEKDYRIPYTQGLQAFNAAKLKGLDAEMLIFPEENHWILQPQNSVIWQRTFFNFLDKHLKSE